MYSLISSNSYCSKFSIYFFLQACFATISNGTVTRGCISKTEISNASSGNTTCDDSSTTCTYYCTGQECNENPPEGISNTHISTDFYAHCDIKHN